MIKRARDFLRVAALAMLALGITACSSSKSGEPDLQVLLFNFAPGFGGVHLNAPLELTFSTAVDPDSVNPDTIRIFTTTTTTDLPDPGAPANGVYVTSANVVTFLPRIPKAPDLSDAGLRAGFSYTIQVPASPDVIEPVRALDDNPGDGVSTGSPNVVPYIENFSTLNQTILPAPGDILAEPNLNSLSLFFIDEGIENGTDPCPRPGLGAADRDSPQVIFTDPAEGERGFGTITGIQAGLGTAFVRLDPITLRFSEPISTWRIRPQNITIQNENLNGETFDLVFFLSQDRLDSRLLITVFDADSAFDQASVPQGRYTLKLTQFTDLAGNPLIDSSNLVCPASGSFELSFSTVSSPTLPTDLILSFGDDDGDGHVDVGGLLTGSNNPNVFPVHLSAFLGGMATNQPGILPPSPSAVTTSANWGDVAFWTGGGVRYDNGLIPPDPGVPLFPDGIDRPIPTALRLRGGSDVAATPILSPLAGRGTGRSNSTVGSTDGEVLSPLPGKVNFELIGNNTARLFTGDDSTGPIVYHYNRFMLLSDASDAAVRPLLTARDGSRFPLMIFVESAAIVAGDIILDGQAGDFGFNGDNGGISLGRNPGGLGGKPLAGAGAGGNGGSAVFKNELPAWQASTDYRIGDMVIVDVDGVAGAELLECTQTGTSGGLPPVQAGTNPTITDNTVIWFVLDDAALINGRNGDVPYNVLGRLEQLSEAVATATGMSTGGGGHYDGTQDKTASFVPAYSGGGAAGVAQGGTNGADWDSATTPGATDHGRGGVVFGNQVDFLDPDILGAAAPGGGGGGADDDGGGDGTEANDVADLADDGGGGGGAGGGFLSLTAAGVITIGIVNYGADNDRDDPDWPGPPAGNDPADDFFETAVIRCVGGRGGSTYSTVSGTPPVPGSDPLNPDLQSAIGQGEAGGGGGGGGMVLIAGEQVVLAAGCLLTNGKRGGNSEDIEAGGRVQADEGGSGGGGLFYFADSDGFEPIELGAPFGSNTNLVMEPDGVKDIDNVVGPDIPDADEMSGVSVLTLALWGDDPLEAGFGETAIVSEFFDTLSDAVSYDEVRVLSNAPDFPYPTDEEDRPIRVKFDVTSSATSGFPNIIGVEDTVTGDFLAPNGATEEIGLHFDQTTGDRVPPALPLPVPPPEAQYDSRALVPAGSSTQGRRYVRVRVLFNLAAVGDRGSLLASFDAPGQAPGQIAPGNSLGNTDEAPAGVPAVADVRLRFTP